MIRYIVIAFLLLFLIEQEAKRADAEGDLSRCQTPPAKQAPAPARTKVAVR